MMQLLDQFLLGFLPLCSQLLHSIYGLYSVEADHKLKAPTLSSLVLVFNNQAANVYINQSWFTAAFNHALGA